MFKILMGEDVVPRKDFINKNAINVNNLDIQFNEFSKTTRAK